jgi:alpha-tubulin suppressor-like RCC1 family protein
MPFTQISTTNIQPNTVVDYATYSTFTTSLAPKIASVNVANSAFTVLDDTAVNVGGGYIVVTGENFAANATVLVDTTQASAVTRVSSTQLRVQVPAKSAATYNLYVVNPDGGTGIRVNGVTYSSDPSWVTSSPLSNQVNNIAFNITLSATSATSYAVAAGSSLPAGTSLLANGYFYGTVSVGAETTYSFVIVATDAENQDASKTFQVTVALPPVRLYAWGQNQSGQLGVNDRVYRSSPTQVGTDTTWGQISTQEFLAVANKTNGTLWSWGSGTSGGHGQNDRVYRSSPTQIGSGTTWSDKLMVGKYFVAAIKTDGTLWSWGQNQHGQLGQNDAVLRSSPVQVGTNTNWSLVGIGNYMAMAIKTDGTLWAWGQNVSGSLGINTTVYKSSPTQIAGTTWSKVSAGPYSAMATRTDGTLWLWGNNNYGGFLGFNNTIYRSSPTQLGTGTDWNQISHGFNSSLAIKTNGTLWAWGRNHKGQLGLNDDVNRSSPVQVGSGTNWSQVDTDSGTAMAIKTDGTLWIWGSNQSGVLGRNTNYTLNISSPVQVGALTTWSKISTGGFASFATTSG